MHVESWLRADEFVHHTLNTRLSFFENSTLQHYKEKTAPFRVPSFLFIKYSGLLLASMTVPWVFGDFFFIQFASDTGFARELQETVFDHRNVCDDFVLPGRAVDVHAHDIDIGYGGA